MTGDVPIRLHAFIEGQVQGVGFRMFVLDEARRLNLTGWVRNTWDGEVEVMAEGPRSALEKLTDVLRHGPRMSYVTNVRSDWDTPTGEFEGFAIRPSF